MTAPNHTPTPSTMRFFVRFGGQTVALLLGDPDDIDQPRKRIIVLPRDPAARDGDPNVRLLRDIIRRQEAHDALVTALTNLADAAEKLPTRALADELADAHAALAKTGKSPAGRAQPLRLTETR